MDARAFYECLNVNIDDFLNPYIPHSRVYRLPPPIRHFLGYRKSPEDEPPALVQWISTVIATLGGLCLVGGLYSTAPGLTKYHPPTMIASLGASAVLDYNAIRSPLAQPRNAIVGHTLSAIVGVCISKLFQLQPTFFAQYGWVSGAVGCACASLVMAATNTIHPPGGATAILASTEASAIALGWTFVPLVLLSSCLMTTVACLLNNILRQYPMYWWTPEDVGQKLREARREAVTYQEDVDGNNLEKQASITSSESTLQEEFNDLVVVEGLGEIHIKPYKVQIPAHLDVTKEDRIVLLSLEKKMRLHMEVYG